jgi:formylmethanofuran dehydrogenase subunit B
MERYAADPVGEFLPEGRAERTLVVADVEPTPSSVLADIYLPIEPGRDFEALWTLRALVRGLPLSSGTSAGAPFDALVDLARRMKSCRCGVIFFGLGLTRQSVGHRNVEALLQLVADLNAFTRFHARRMRVPGDVTGADNVLCWQTGYPFSVNLSRGYPRYNPGEYSANDMLQRQEVDACLLVGSEGVSDLSEQAVAHLQRIPTIALDYPTFDSLASPTVRFTTAIYGIHLPGTAYRMDEVPIPLRAFLPARYPSDADVLNGILRRIAAG